MSNLETLAALFATGGIELRRGPLFDKTPPTLPPSPRLRDRVEGMLLGLAIGDALGNTSEGLLPGERRARYGEVRDYLPNRYAEGRRVGLPSDDTQLAFWTLAQLLEDGGLVPEHLARRFAAERIFGIGSTARGFLANLNAGVPWHQAGPHSAGNGALMRIAPVVLPHLSDPSPALWADTALAAMLTHNDSASTAACLPFVRLLWELLGRDTPPAPEWWLDRYLETARELELDKPYTPRGGAYPDLRGPLWRYVEKVVPPAWAEGLDMVAAGQRWHSGAYLLETVPSVLYLLMRHGHDPEEAIVRAVNDTLDNDTIAAIVGAAVGALHGRSRLPTGWVENLLGRTAAEDDGQVFELLEAACERWVSATREGMPAPPVPRSHP